MIGHVTGEVESEDRVLVIRRIHVTYRLKTAAENHDAALRVNDMHKGYCPVYRSIHDSIDITTDVEFLPED